MTKKQILLLAIFLIFSICTYSFFHFLVKNKIVIGYNQGYKPTQPFPFSHKLHAGAQKIACNYCHTNVGTERHATVPSLKICMNCHMVVKPESPFIQKLTEHYTSNIPIQWKKVNLLPDHVKFNHAKHISKMEVERGEKKNTSCKHCHGSVEEMNVLYQFSSLSMGWCISCHRQPENDAPTEFLKIRGESLLSHRKPENRAPIECTTCHY